jgi:hypothetical protein
MHLCEIEALAVGQDGSGPSPVAEGQLPGAASNSQSRPVPDLRRRVQQRSLSRSGCPDGSRPGPPKYRGRQACTHRLATVSLERMSKCYRRMTFFCRPSWSWNAHAPGRALSELRCGSANPVYGLPPRRKRLIDRSGNEGEPAVVYPASVWARDGPCRHGICGQRRANRCKRQACGCRQGYRRQALWGRPGLP